MTPTSMARALKEWAVVVRALEAGQQLVILRKGGISEEHHEFRIEHREFVFYATYEHQAPESLHPTYRPVLERVLAEPRDPNEIRVSAYAEVTASFDITDSEQLAVLRSFHIWSDEYVAERLRWRPTKPLAALALRVYRLAAPITLPYRPSYRGCTSWVELEDPVSLSGVQPAVSDDDYATRVNELRSALEHLESAVEPTP